AVGRDGGARAEVEDDLDAAVERAADHLAHRVEQSVKREPRREALASPREPEERAREPDRVLGHLVNEREVALLARVVLAALHRLGDELDRGEEVVEVVRDPARELADRLEAQSLVEAGLARG